MLKHLSSHPIQRAGFTLVELLTVVTIILILVGMVSGISGFVTEKQARSQAETTIRALGGAIDRYEIDYGVYPAAVQGSDAATLDPRQSADPSTYTPAIRAMAQELYSEDAQENYLKGFKPSTVVISGGTVTQILDPWGNSYGYSTARNVDLQENPTSDAGFNPTYDLWSTANKNSHGAIDGWVSNW